MYNRFATPTKLADHTWRLRYILLRCMKYTETLKSRQRSEFEGMVVGMSKLRGGCSGVLLQSIVLILRYLILDRLEY